MIELIKQSVGFLIQTVPMGCIFFSAFSKEKLRLGGRRLYAALAAILLCLSVIFAGGMGAMAKAGYGPEEIKAHANLYMTLTIVICTVPVFANVRERLSKRILMLFVNIYYEAIIYSFGTLVEHTFLTDTIPDALPYTTKNLCLIAALTALTLPAFYWFTCTRIRGMLADIEGKRTVRACFYVCTELLLYILFVKLVPGDWKETNFYMVVCYCISNMIIMYMFFSEIQLAWQSAVMEEKFRLFDLEYQSINNRIREMQNFRHDMRHHLGIISTLNSQGKQAELSAYLNKYIRVYEGMEADTICDYPLVDTILKYYIERAEREGIRVTKNILLHEDLGFDFMDLTVLLGNGLENAIEANLLLPRDQRWIYIEMMKVKGTMLILIENGCTFHKTGRQGRFVRHALFLEGHPLNARGIGLESIHHVAEKYGGSAEYKQEENTFAIRIVLNIQPNNRVV